MNKIGLTLVLLLTIGQLQAQEREKIQVKFSILEKDYHKRYGSKIDEITTICSQKIIKKLNHTFKFLQFTSAASNHTMYIHLGDSNKYNVPHPVFFHLSLRTPDSDEETKYVTWRFRSLEQHKEPLDMHKVFTEEVTQRFNSRVNFNKDDLVRYCVSKVNVAGDYHYIELNNEKLFAIPLSQKIHGINDFSEFRIEALAPNPLVGEQLYTNITQVKYPIVDKNYAMVTFNLPEDYPEWSILVIRKQDQGEAIENLDTSQIIKKVFIWQYLQSKI